MNLCPVRSRPGRALFGPLGAVGDATDCDDGDADINPSASEVCNGYDDDCDELIDVRRVSHHNGARQIQPASVSCRAAMPAGCAQAAGTSTSTVADRRSPQPSPFGSSSAYSGVSSSRSTSTPSCRTTSSTVGGA